MLASFAAAQDWDGLWLFAYAHDPGQWESGCFRSFFDIHANASKWGFMQAGAAIFRDAGLPPLRECRTVLLARPGEAADELVRLHARYGSNLFAALAEREKITWRDLLAKRLAVAMTQPPAGPSGAPGEGPAMTWQVDQKGHGTFAAAGAGAVAWTLSAASSERAAPGQVTLSRPAFAAITMTALDCLPMHQSRKVLITACGRAENTDMVFSQDRRSVGRSWGRAPARIEAVEGTVSLPAGEWECHALAPTGQASAGVPIQRGADGKSVVHLSAKWGTMWYLLTRK